MLSYAVLVFLIMVVSGLTNGIPNNQETVFPAVNDGEDYLSVISGIEGNEIIPQEKRTVMCPPLSRFWSFVPCYRRGTQQKDMTKSELLEKIKKYIMKHYKGGNYAPGNNKQQI